MVGQRFQCAGWLVGAAALVLVGCGTDPAPAPSVRVTINELMSSNRNYEITTGTGATPDWIELYNAGDEDVDLAGYYMGDSARHRLDQRLGAGNSVPANGFLVLQADGLAYDPYLPDGGREHYVPPGHLEFKLSDVGEAVWLTDPNGYVVSYTEFGPYPLADAGNGEEASWARFPDGTGEFVWCSKPTAGRFNGSACQGQIVP